MLQWFYDFHSYAGISLDLIIFLYLETSLIYCINFLEPSYNLDLDSYYPSE